MTDKPVIEWRDTGQRADQVLTMVAAILIERAGGAVEFTRDEWNEVNRRYGGDAAVLFFEDGTSIIATIETTAGAAQRGALQ